MDKQVAVEIHNLAVLRASTEGKHLGTYFGSWGALDFWVSNTRVLGWIDSKGGPTDAGAAIATELNLSGAGDGRAYMWRNASNLVAAAKRIAAAAEN